MSKKHNYTVKRIRTRHLGIYRIHRYNSKTRKYELSSSSKKFTATKQLLVKGVAKQIEKSFECLAEALDWRMYGEKEVIVAHSGSLTFDDLIEEFFKSYKSRVRKATFDKAIKNLKHLTVFFGKPLSKITPRFIDLWLLEVKKESYLLTQNKTRTSYREEIKHLRLFFNYAREYLDVRIVNPILKRHHRDAIVDMSRFNSAKQAARTRFLNAKEATAVEQSLVDLGKHSEKYELMSLMARTQLRTGLRVSEAGALYWNDILHEEGNMAIMISKTVEHCRSGGDGPKLHFGTKNNESRIVPISRDHYELLLRLKLKIGRREGLIFSLDGETPLAYRQLQHFYNKAFKMAGLSQKGTHLMRHTFATLFLQSTGDQVALKGILGHRNLSQTDHYAKVTLKTMVDAANIFHEKTPINNMG